MQSSHPLLPLSPPALIFPSIRVFSWWVSSSHQVVKVLELLLKHQSFQWISRLISFRMDWLDLPAVQGTLKSLFQYHNLKASILWCSAFFIVQLSHLYMTTGKPTALTIWTFASKVMSLLFNLIQSTIVRLKMFYFCVCFLCNYLCEKYYKLNTVQYI